MHRIVLPALLLLAGCHASPTPARPAPPAPTQTRTASAPTAQRLVSISAHETSVSEVLAQIGSQSGRNIACEPGIEDRVTLNLRDVHWTEALELVLDWTHCEARELGETLYVTQPPRVTLQGICD